MVSAVNCVKTDESETCTLETNNTLYINFKKEYRDQVQINLVLVLFPQKAHP